MNVSPGAWLETINGERLPLTASCPLGRAPENRVVVVGEKISRRHALIHRQNETEYWLVDLGSRNGTFRNGIRVKQPTQLHPGDRIEVGSVQFTFVLNSAKIRRGEPAQPSLAETIATKRISHVWLMNVDVVNFSFLAQSLSAEELALQLGSWLLRCSDLVEQSGGCVDKYVGDGFMAYWQAIPSAQARFPDALQALTSLQNEGTFRFRWTAHYASLPLGLAQFGNDSLVGKEINFAFRLEKIAGSLQLPRLLSKSAVDSLPNAIKARSVGIHPVKGFPGEHEFFTT